jgi:Rps23 Pro-64 3,4-dihydroxylase Tpa1-like proline 4-hydroxylase
MRLFEPERLRLLAEQRKDDYSTADPFPHIVIDDFLPPEICDQLLAEFPSADAAEWQRVDKHHSRKLATTEELKFGPTTRNVLAEFSSPTALRFLETLTGIAGLIPDPYFTGGGLHQIVTGGFLKIHADFNHHTQLKLDRRLNLIVYLNKDWREEYKGHLELWDRDMKGCVRKILPIFNRCVVFSTTDWSYHGHPEHLACPPTMTRKSLALYYYSNGRPESETSDTHGTLWQERPAPAGTRQMAAMMLTGLAGAAETPAKLLRRIAQTLGRNRAA